MHTKLTWLRLMSNHVSKIINESGDNPTFYNQLQLTHKVHNADRMWTFSIHCKCYQLSHSAIIIYINVHAWKFGNDNAIIMNACRLLFRKQFEFYMKDNLNHNQCYFFTYRTQPRCQRFLWSVVSSYRTREICGRKLQSFSNYFTMYFTFKIPFLFTNLYGEFSRAVINVIILHTSIIQFSVHVLGDRIICVFNLSYASYCRSICCHTA